MVKSIKLTIDDEIINIEELPPCRTTNMVIFSNNGRLLLWEPFDVKSTKTEMKQYVQAIGTKLSSIIGQTTVLAHGLVKYEWLGDNDFEVTLGGVVLAKVTYVDDKYEDIKSIEYRPRFVNLSNIKDFI